MKVREVIEQLMLADPEDEFVVSSDEEGNSYRPGAVSIGETMCNQYGEWVSVHPQDLEEGEYEGWEDSMFSAVVAW